MRALTVVPQSPGSLALTELEDPRPAPGELLVQGLAVGVCGTDREIAAGDYGTAPDGAERLVIGHESFGRVLEAPDGSDFRPGDLVAGIVRRPDPEPCGACAHGYFDMCRNGGYTERGIKELHGFASELWTVEADYALRLDPALGDAGVLMEPTSVVAKAWDEIERIGSRSWFEPQRVLVTGAGPIGLLAAMLGRQRGLDVHVLDRVETGVKPELVAALGATYHAEGFHEAVGDVLPDVVIEATGVPSLVLAAMGRTTPYGIVCLTGISVPGKRTPVDAGELNRSIVLDNDVVFGSVNANRAHYALAAEALAAADREWLDRVVSRRVPLDGWAEAFTDQDDDVKIAITLGE